MIFLISSACFDIHFLQIDCCWTRVDALYGTWYAVGLFVIASSTVFVEVSLGRTKKVLGTWYFKEFLVPTQRKIVLHVITQI